MTAFSDTRKHKGSNDGKGFKKNLAGTLIKREKKGNDYLRYYVGGKQTTQRLTNDKGKPIALKADLLAPLSATKRSDQLKAVRAKLEDTDRQKQRALDERNDLTTRLPPKPDQLIEITTE